MSLLDDKPTAGTIRQMVQHLSDVWRDTHIANVLRDTYYNRTFALWPKGVNRPVLHPGKPRAIVDHAVDQLQGSSPTVRRFGERHKADNDAVERAMEAVFHQAGLKEHSLSFKQAAKHLVLYGYSVVESDLDSKDLALARREKPTKVAGDDEEDLKQKITVWEHQRRTVMPFRIHAPHPNSVLLDPVHKNPRVAIKMANFYAQDLADLTKFRKELKRGDVELFEFTGNPFQPVPCYVYWTEKWQALMTAGSTSWWRRVMGSFAGPFMGPASGKVLITEPNHWGFVPFAHCFSGRGSEHAATAFNPAQLAVGFLDHVMDDLWANAQDAAAKHNILIEAAFMAMGQVGGDTAETEEALATSGIVPVQSKGSLFYLERPNLPRQIADLDAGLDRDIEDATYLSALGGQRQVGVNTVGATAINFTAGQRTFIDLAEQLNHLATTSMEHILQWVDTLELDLLVEGHELKPSLVHKDYTGQVVFQVKDPVLQLQTRQQALTEHSAGTLSLESLWEQRGTTNASQERRRMIQDLVYADPRVVAEFARVEAEALGLERLLHRQPPAGGTNGNQAPSPTLLGPDGMPMASTLGTTGPQQAASQIDSGLRKPLTPQVAKPGRTGQNTAG